MSHQGGGYKVLDLYAGLGGNRKKWENCQVTAVEMDSAIAAEYARQYPNDEVIIGDAHQYLLDHYNEFDFIWSSPPCQSHSKMDRANYRNAPRYPDLKLYEEIIFLQTYFDGYWIVENVNPYYEPLIKAHKVGRHLFWANFSFHAFDIDRPADFINLNTSKEKSKLMDWLGIQYEKNIYYSGNHCPLQVLRNCVHPDLGLQIFNQAIEKGTGKVIKVDGMAVQGSLI